MNRPQMSLCQHADIMRFQEREDGRVLWVCTCGRKPTTLPHVTKQELLGMMLGMDLLRSAIQPNRTGAPASAEPAAINEKPSTEYLTH